MTLLENLKSILLPEHTLTIKALSKDSYFRDYNKKHKDDKYLYCIKISCPDSKAGQDFLENEFFTLADIVPSKQSKIYNKQISQILDNFSNGQIYVSCTTECNTEIEYTIRWLAKSLVKA